MEKNKKVLDATEVLKKQPNYFMNGLHDEALADDKVHDVKKKAIERKIKSLTEESEEFFNELRATNEYKQEFNKILKLYKIADQQEIYGAVNMQRSSIEDFRGIPKAVIKNYPFIENLYSPEKQTSAGCLVATAKAYKLALFVTLRDALMKDEMQVLSYDKRPFYIKKLAECDIDIDRLKEYRAFRLKSGSKIVAVKDETKKPLPEIKVLFPQIEKEVRRSISVAVKRFRQETVAKGQSFLVNNKKALELEQKYINLIKQDFGTNLVRYNRDCERANDVVNTYFDVNGHSVAKYSDIGRAIIKEGAVVVVESEPEGGVQPK
jgi:hypothetical protein